MAKVYSDPCSFSNPEAFLLTHVNLNWTVDFDTKVIHGKSRLSFNRLSADAKNIVLDTRDLVINSILDEASNTTLDFQIGDRHSAFGSALTIDLNKLKSLDQLSTLNLVIDYRTSPNASALQWIDCKATCGKKHPYLFSQCQAIHARSIVPIQDTPQVKFTYHTNVTVSNPLVALMSACSTGSINSDASTTYKFEQNTKIPSYLLAVVVGDLVGRDVGPISKVWTERELLEEAAYEFGQVNEMIVDAQVVCGEYAWGRYDLLVMPPSFPYGGMENPCLTFVTPTIIARDRSLVDVVQHEITHSWTGNLVTNCSWEHFWLNEGFTRYIERVLVMRLKNNNEKLRQFEFIDGWRHLIEEVQHFGDTNQLTQLVVNLTNVDPDDAFSSIPYEKGAILLYYLETILGGFDVFIKYLKAHIERFSGKSIDTNDWKTYLYEYFHDKREVLDSVDWNTWLYKPGMPPVIFNFDNTLALEVETLTKKLLNENIETVDALYLKFESNQKRELLSQLYDRDPLSHQKLESLNGVYKFGETFNSEILFRWLRLCTKAKWLPIIDPALHFVSRQGRMKFTRPIYRDLYSWDEARTLAIQNFQSQRIFMHQTTASLVARDLGLPE